MQLHKTETKFVSLGNWSI